MLKWILILVMFVPTAWGYRLTTDFLNGFYWASLPISITVVDADVTRKTLMESFSKKAIVEWQERTGLNLWTFQPSPNQGATLSSNTIRWSTNFAEETRMDPVSVLAVAIRYTEGPYFSRTEIVVNGNHYLNQDNANLLTTITHELGHTMGLDHSDNMAAVMAPTLQSPYRGLDGDDVQGMEFAQDESHTRQITNYVSPLAYEKKASSGGPISCGTITVAGAGTPSLNGPISLGMGLLLGFARKIFKWLKRLLS